MFERVITAIPVEWEIANPLQSKAIGVANYRDVDMTVIGSGTVNVLASKNAVKGPESPGIKVTDFNAASVLGNSYGPIVIADESVPNTYSTAITVANSTKLCEINTNLVTYICIQRDSADVDVEITVCTNQ